MKNSFALTALGVLLVAGTAQAAEATVTDKTFGCVRDGTKARNTYFRHTDPAKLKEAVRIYENKVAGVEYPVGTIVQLVPNEAMVKHTKAEFPNSNGWEFFALEVSASGTKITGRGDTAANPAGTCLSCHQAAAKYDFLCSKDQGCAPIPFTEEQLAGRQKDDPRCTGK